MLRDVVDLVKELKNIADDIPEDKVALNRILKAATGGNLSKSVTRRAKNNLCQFPLLISSAAEKESVPMCTKALEREYSTLLRFVIGQDDIIDLKNFDKKSYIKKLHQNNNIHPSASYISDINEFLESNIVILNKEELRPFMEDFKSGSINDLTIKNYEVIKESLKINSDINYYAEADEEMTKDELDYHNKVMDTQLKAAQLQKTNAEQQKISRDIKKLDNERSKDYKTGITTNIVDLDVKKSNELMPTVMEVMVEYKAGDTFKTTNLLLGVKCVAHVIPTEEMVYFVSKSLRENRFAFRTIQWTTGEIKFWKDFVLSLDRIKAEASKSNKSSIWWSFLRGRAKNSKFKGLLGKEGFIPNTTLALTMSEVEFLKNNEGIDLFNASTAHKLMNIFFLLRVMILDDIDEVAYMFDEEQRTWSHYSYNQLEKEKSSSNKDLKSLVSLINR